MSISLNDHETRIKVLEQQIIGSGKLKITQLYRGTNYVTSISFSQSLENFDFVVFVGQNNSGTVHSHHVMCVELLKTFDIPNKYDVVICDNAVDSSQGYLTLTGWRQKSQNNMRIIGVYGLKIYYIFRYNIWKYSKLISLILKEV